MEYTLKKENGFKGTLILLKNQFKKKNPKPKLPPPQRKNKQKPKSHCFSQRMMNLKTFLSANTGKVIGY